MPAQYPLIETTPGSRTESNGRLTHAGDWTGYRVAAQTTVFGSGTPQGGHQPQPSFLQVLVRLVRNRWKLFIAWCAVAAVLAALVVAAFGRPVWRAGGKLEYAPKFASAIRRLYTPPNIQTVLARLKSDETLRQVESNLKLPENSLSVTKNVKIDVGRSSDLIICEVDDPSPEKALVIGVEIMQVGSDRHETMRRNEIEKAIEDKKKELKSAMAKQKGAQGKLDAELRDKGVNVDLKVEIESVFKEINENKSKIQELKRLEASLPKQIENTEKEIQALSTAKKDGPSVSVSPAVIQAINQLETAVSQTRIELNNDRKKLMGKDTLMQRYLEVQRKGALAPAELDEIKQEVQALKDSVIERGKLLEKLETNLQRQRSEADGSQTAGLSGTLLTLRNNLETAKTDIPKLEGRVAELDKRLKDLRGVESDLFDLVNQVVQCKTAADTTTMTISENELLLSPDFTELRTDTKPSVGTAPVASNYAKLAAGVFAAMMMLFLGFVVAKDLPTFSLSGEVTARRANLPLLSVYKEGGAASSETGVTPAAPSLQALAEGLRGRFPERGSVVQFIPASGSTRVDSMAGDLACYLAQYAGKVLVFDARGGDARIPAWAGTAGGEAGQRVEDYLRGDSDSAAGCFAVTKVSAVEYSRANLVPHVNNMIGMYRFHRLIEEMRERYAMVFLVSPVMPADAAGENHLGSLVDGSILVLDGDRNPPNTQNYVDSLRAGDQPLMGAVVFENRAGGW